MLEAKLIPGYDCYYIDKEANIYSTFGGRLKKLSPCINGHGYVLVTLGAKSQRVHRLLAKTFMGLTDESGLVINHKDFNRANNSLDNLEVVTTKENMTHSRMAGRFTQKRGQENAMSKYTDEFVLKLRRMCELGLHDKEVASILGISSGNVNRIRLRRRWSHI